jgi:hypothetical protein
MGGMWKLFFLEDVRELQDAPPPYPHAFDTVFLRKATKTFRVAEMEMTFLMAQTSYCISSSIPTPPQ